MEFLNEIKSALFTHNPDVELNLKKCNNIIRLFNKKLSKATSVSEKQRFTAAMGQIKSYKAMFNALKITGEGYSPRKETARDRVKWIDLPSAFNGRIRTGCITNLHHRDPKLFL